MKLDQILKVQEEGMELLNRVAATQKSISRKHDMSPAGTLTLHQQDDGDMCLSIYDDENEQFAGVEFTTPFMGGGGSTNTWAALKILFLAMTLDQNGGGHRAGRYEVEEEVKKLLSAVDDG